MIRTATGKNGEHFFATKIVVHPHLSSSHLSFLSKRENKKGQREKQELSQRCETAPVRGAMRPFQPGKVGGKSTDLWDPKQLGVNYSPTLPAEELRVGDEESKVQIQTSNRRWFVWQWIGSHRSIVGKEYCGCKKSVVVPREGWTGTAVEIC